MDSSPTPVVPRDQRLADILAKYRAEVASGHTPDPEALIAQEPDLEKELRALFAPVTLSLAPTETSGKAAASGSGSATPPMPDPQAVTLSRSGDWILAYHAQKDFGDYELLEQIGQGGMGVVFRAREKTLQRMVALKMILAGQLASRDQVRRFQIEAEQGGTLDHPNIVPIYHVGEESGQHYFTMKLIEGGSLRDHVGRYQADPRAAAHLMATVAHAIHYAHQHGVLHRDIKPGNILFDSQGQPHVTDFGLAKHLGGGEEAITISGVLLGTPSYMSPEQASSRKQLTTASDVYSLGAVLYELLTGRAPFKGAGTVETIDQVLHREPTAPRMLNPKVPRDLETICLHCLAKDPKRRYGTAEALAKDLERYLAGEPIRARPVGLLERSLKWMQRRPAVAALILVSGLAVFSLCVGGWWYNVRLHSALQTAQANEVKAEQQSQLVTESFAKRVATVDDFLIRMDGRLANQRGAESVRLEFLQEFLQLSRGLMAEQQANVSARKQTAAVHRRIGDLWSETGNFQPAETAYRQSIDLLTKLTDDFPQSSEYGDELAMSHAHRARLLDAKQRYADAYASFEKAMRIEEQLATEALDKKDYARKAAYYRFELANCEEESGKLPHAEQLYQEALKQQEELVRSSPRQLIYYNDLSKTAGSLGLLLRDSRPADAERYLEQAVETQRKLRRAAPAAPNSLQESYTDLAGFYKRNGRHADLFRMAQDYRRDSGDDFGVIYNQACFVANAAEAVPAQISSTERERLVDQYAAQAVVLLDKALMAGWNNREHVNKDPDLNPLRSRKDYKEWLTSWDNRRAEPRTPEREFRSLSNGFMQDQQIYEAMKQAARTVADKKRAEERRPRFEDFAQRCLQFAEQNRESSAAVEALAWVLENCQPADQKRPEVKRLHENVLALLQRDFFQRAELGNVCPRLAENPQPAIEELLRAALRKHSRPEVRGLAGYALGLALAKQANDSRAKNPAQAAQLADQAEKQIEQVLTEYPSVPYGQTTLGAIGRDKLYELRHLSIGRPAAEIEGEDLAGKRFKLSDLRGKVVVLDFWVNWCGYCRQMYPQERQLVEEFKGRPFALVGVNCDDDKTELMREIQRQGLNWPSWWDGGPAGNRIAKEWQVHSFPTVYILDHKGVIRYKNPRGSELDNAVNQLVQECEASLRASVR
jgi:thiol-disulfide isomerase/thioredoxin/tetratricopeptide (TPR) repeat protein